MYLRGATLVAALVLCAGSDVPTYTCEEGKYTAAPLFQLEGLESMQECQKTCNEIPDCRAVVFNVENKACSVHGSEVVGGTLSVDGSSLRCVKDSSSVKPQGAQEVETTEAAVVGAFTCKTGGFNGEELLVIEHTNLQACADHCEKIEGCAKLSHQQGGDVCTLYGRGASDDAKTATTACEKNVKQQEQQQQQQETAAVSFECSSGKKYGGALFTIGETGSLEECQRQCAVFSSVCRGINYGSDKSCELVESVDSSERVKEEEMTACRIATGGSSPGAKKDDKAAEASPKVEAAKDEKDKKAVFSCTSDETLEGGELVSFGDVKTMQGCQDYCLSFGSACGAFVYTSKSENCELKDETAKAARTRGDGAVTCRVEEEKKGRRQPHGKGEDYTCSGARGFVGGHLKTASGYGRAECRELCSADAECFLYVVPAEGVCVLKTSKAVEATEGAEAALQMKGEAVRGEACVKASAQRAQEKALGFGAIIEEEEEEARRKAALVDVAPFFECVGRAAFDPVAVLKRVGGVVGAAACREKCHVLARCKHAAHNAAEQECVLLGARGAVTVAAEAAHEVCTKQESRDVAGYRCTRGSYSGGTVATVYGVGTARECARACSSSLGCLIAVHHPDDKRCVLKSVRAVPTQGVLERATACVSEKVGEPQEGFHCAAEGAATLADGTLSLLSDVTLEGCREQCERQAECTAVQYAAAARACELKSHEAAVGAGREGVVTCTRHPRAGGPAAEKSRYAQTLGSGPSVEAAAYIRVKFGFHVEELSKEVFEGLNVRPGSADTTTLWVTLFVRVPVGVDPAQYGLSAYHLLATELNRDDNIFMLKLNPTLEHLGLERIRPGAGGRWSLIGDAFEWRPLPNGVLSLPVLFKPGMPLEPESARRWLARAVASELSVPASTVSMEEIAGCTDAFGSEGCVTSWTGATADSSGGPTGVSLAEPTTRRVGMLIDVPTGFTAHEWCRNVTRTLPCDGVHPTSFLYKTFGLHLCGLCEEEELAPTDGTASVSTQRHLLQQKGGEVVDGRSATALQAAIGARQGLPRSCSAGWKPESYGVMSDAFNVESGAEVTGATLKECIAACTAANGCYAFSRNRGLSNDEAGTCWLKRTVVPTVGDQYGFDGLGTYVVSCPPAVEPCKWKYMDGYDQRSLSSRTTSFRTQTAAECKDLCELVEDCTGMTFDREDGTCYFTHDLVQAPTAARQDEGFFSAVCYRVVPDSPCDTSYCGVNPSVGCFPLRGGDHRCTCAEGFTCVGNCDEPRKPHLCNRAESLEALLQEALSVALNIDAYGISTKEASHMLRGSGDPNERGALTPEEANSVTVSSSKLDVQTEHVLSVTFSKGQVEDLLEEEQGQTKAELLAGALSAQLGGAEAFVKRLCKVTNGGVTAACFDTQGASLEIPTRPTVKPTPEREQSTAAAWCGGLSALSAMANPKTVEALEELVEASKGEMLETRTYWVGATCAETCNSADSWDWADAPAAPVDWASLAHGGRGEAILTDLTGASCAVMQYDAETLRWGLNVADCGADGHYPVCVDTSTEPVDHAELCDASGSCDLRVTFSTTLLHTRIVHFVSLPDGKTKKFHPSDLLPAGARLVNRDGDLLGFVDDHGHTTVISWPPVDQPLNAALKEVMSGFTYPMEGLHALVNRHMESWMSSAKVDASFSKACHELIKQKHVLCVDAICELVEPIMITRTSCEGAPPCLNSVCNGHGYAKGFVGFCSCQCEKGFAGPTCSQCASGYKNYPTCEVSGIGEPMFEVFHLHLQSEKDTTVLNRDLLEQDFTTLLEEHMEGFQLLYICPQSECPDPCTSPVNTWSEDRRGECARAGTGWTERSAVVLSGSRDFYPLVASGATIAEIAVTYAAGSPADASETVMQILKDVVGSNEGPLGKFYLLKVTSVFGPSTEEYGGVTPVAAPFNPPVAVGGAGELVDGAGTDMGIIIVIAIAVVLFCCCFMMFGIWRHRKAQERKNKERTEDLMMKYTNEDEDGEDVVTIFKGATESMGIMWDDHTLMVGICEDSPASRYNLDRFRNRRLARVNGKKVYTLNDIRDAVEGETCVTLEFEPKYSAIVVRVASKLEDFYEQEFISMFADRIAEALNLMEFSEMDIDLQSIFERPERGELLLTMKLIGLTSDQVATIVAMCVTPGEPIRNGLPIAGAYLATAKFGEESNPPLWVCAQWLPEAAECSGCYLRLPGVMEGGHPVWQHAPADHWLYSTPSGYWAIVRDKALVGSDVTTGGYVLRSTEPHRGAEPHVVTGWRTALREDQHASVTKEELTAHEFVVGQRVVFPVDLQLEDGSVINKRSEALVMCEQGDLVQVCMLNEEYDILTVAPEVVDSPDGPRVMVYENDQWMAASIVKTKGSQIKVSFDCGLCPDMWLDKDAEADRLKLMTRAAFTVGDKVQLSSDAPHHLEGDGCLAFGELGVVVACGDAGQARPYLVEGPCDMTWYSGVHLSLFNTNEDSAPFASETDYSAPFGGEMDEAPTTIDSERKNQ